MEIRSVIIDDDPFILKLLQDKLHQYLPEICVAAVARSGREGLEKITYHQPDLIFLDVEMADMTGFEMLARLQQIPFQTIFITSYNHYAIQAIRFNALDYLTKPIDLGELKQAIERYKAKVKIGNGSNEIRWALRNLNAQTPSEQVLHLHLQEGDVSLHLQQIIRIEGERNYSNIYLTDQSKKLISKTLAYFEELLAGSGFFRCHKSHIVNFYHIQPYTNGWSLLLSDGSRIPIARRKKEGFLTWYDSLSADHIERL